jgi:hypothetical protein
LRRLLPVQPFVTTRAGLETCLKVLDELLAVVSFLERPVEFPILLDASLVLLLLDGRGLSRVKQDELRVLHLRQHTTDTCIRN